MSWIDDNKLFLNIPIEELLALVIYGESANQGQEGMQGVLSVIRNRAKESKFIDSSISSLTGNNLYGVILKKWQFSAFNLDDPVRAKLVTMGNNFGHYLSVNANLRKAYDLARNAFNTALPDNTGGATYYHTRWISPYWSKVYTITTKIGDHIFYSDKSIPYITAGGVIITGIILYFLYIKK